MEGGSRGGGGKGKEKEKDFAQFKNQSTQYNFHFFLVQSSLGLRCHPRKTETTMSSNYWDFMNMKMHILEKCVKETTATEDKHLCPY